mmetsp:Transcript_44327/g.90475  ORF Transcript_44327/g.90475 Transcript_44327/m.90475 type:complete len:362 (+) Transcript_44327:54-1139(+)
MGFRDRREKVRPEYHDQHREKEKSFGDDLLGFLKMESFLKGLEGSCACARERKDGNTADRSGLDQKPWYSFDWVEDNSRFVPMPFDDDGGLGSVFAPASPRDKTLAELLAKKKHSSEAVSLAQAQHKEALDHLRKRSEANDKIAKERARKYTLDMQDNPRTREAMKFSFLNNHSETNAVESARKELQEIAAELEKAQQEDAHWENQIQQARDAHWEERVQKVVGGLPRGEIPPRDEADSTSARSNSVEPPPPGNSSERVPLGKINERTPLFHGSFSSTSPAQFKRFPSDPIPASTSAEPAALTRSTSLSPPALARQTSAPAATLTRAQSQSFKAPRRGVVPVGSGKVSHSKSARSVLLGAG